MPEPHSAPVRVLAVCTGNICRSPAVERLLAAGLGGPGADVVVASAGTDAVAGHGVSAPMARLLASAGVPHEGFAARQLTVRDVEQADLVLALTRAHRSAVVALEPRAVRRSFTLTELARLATAVAPGELPAGGPGERLRALVPLATAQRGRHRHRPEDDDIEDPYGRGDAVYARVFAQVSDAVGVLVRIVAG